MDSSIRKGDHKGSFDITLNSFVLTRIGSFSFTYLAILGLLFGKVSLGIIILYSILIVVRLGNLVLFGVLTTGLSRAEGDGQETEEDKNLRRKL